MKLRTIVFASSFAMAILVAPSPADAAVTTTQAGDAFGQVNLDVGTGDQSDIGHYAVAVGQLGDGDYALTTTCTSGTESGTARLTRSDGTTLRGTVTSNQPCDTIAGGAEFTVTLTTGSHDLVAARLVFRRGSVVTHPTPGGEAGNEFFVVSGTATVTHRIGYWMLDAGGNVYGFGGAPTGNRVNNAAVAHVESTPTGDGYWIVDRFGSVYALGKAHWYGNADRRSFVPGEEVVSLSASPTGHGYWLFTNRGRVEGHGDALVYGVQVNAPLNQPIVGSIATPSGHGYYMVAADGGVFTFGDARFHGSTGDMHLNQPIVGIARTSNGGGYWLVASDGGVFAFHAPFLGSMGATRLNASVVGMVRYGSGYLMVGADGGIFNFAKTAPFFGSLFDTAVGRALAPPIRSVASAG